MRTSENHACKRPREIAHSQIGKSKENRDEEDFGTHHVRKVVVPERKAGQIAEILNDVADHNEKREEHKDTAQAVEHGAVHQRKDERRKNVQGNDGQHGDFARENLENPSAGVKHDQRVEDQSDSGLFLRPIDQQSASWPRPRLQSAATVQHKHPAGQERGGQADT